jgi:hypothetical protein
MVRATESLEKQLRLYESQSDSWRPDRREASWSELQQVVAFANFLYDRIGSAARQARDGRSRPLGGTSAMSYAVRLTPEAEEDLSGLPTHS